MAEISTDDVETAMLTHADPVVTVSDLNDELDCSDRHLLSLLRALEHIGTVQSKQTGARAVAWWHADRVLPPHSHEGMTNEGRANSKRTANEQRENDERNTNEPKESDTDAIAQAVENAAANWDDTDERIEDRKEAAYAVLSALRERPMSKSEIIDEFYPKHPVEGQSERTWWRANLAEGSAPIKDVAEYNPGTQKWEI